MEGTKKIEFNHKSMKYLIYIAIGLCCLPSCKKDNKSKLFKSSSSFADGSYEDFEGTAIFIKERIADTINGGWTHHEKEIAFLLTVVDEQGVEKIQISLNNIIPIEQDTVYLSYSELGTGRDFPTASLHFVDDDVSFETYNLLNQDEKASWLLVEDINSDATEISGTFNLSFITSYEDYLTDERERWDDPNRPDTLHFTNGVFKSVFGDLKKTTKKF